MEKPKIKCYWLREGSASFMKWENCTLRGKEHTGEDALGNPTFSMSNLKVCKARFTPWTNEEIQMESREVTQNERKLLLRLSFPDYPSACSGIIVEGKDYEIMKEIDLSPRFVLLHVKKYKR